LIISKPNHLVCVNFAHSHRRQNRERIMETNYFENPKIAKQWIHSIETKDHWLKNETVYPAIQEWIDANEIKQVIDLGCGQGNALEFLAIDEYIGIDSSETLINRALELYGSHF
jgi:2-polyprenyl-3-methyl-5-hydroxy-6-metoxy-1,4-benzoquinol methylase